MGGESFEPVGAIQVSPGFPSVGDHGVEVGKRPSRRHLFGPARGPTTTQQSGARFEFHQTVQRFDISHRSPAYDIFASRTQNDSATWNIRESLRIMNSAAA